MAEQSNDDVLSVITRIVSEESGVDVKDITRSTTFYLYFLGNIRGGIYQGVFEEGNTIVGSALTFYSIFLPDM